MEQLRIEYTPVSALVPYENNAKQHPPEQVEHIANSIREFGFRQPLVVDADNVVVIGHGRLMAAKKLGLETVPVVRADDLSEAKIKALRLADNKTNESEWDVAELEEELAALEEAFDMSGFGFEDINNDSWFRRDERDGTQREEGNDDYNEFLDKFIPAKTTDDCYTPDIVYDAVADWVAKEYGLNRRNFKRPFYPGGDYQREKYAAKCVVVDNPPFSILAEIIKWYSDHEIKFFLFAPSLTLFSSSSSSCCFPCGVGITYENGAVVSTSFVTNLEDNRIRIIPELYNVVEEANNKNLESTKKTLPKYKYPDYVLTAAMCNYMCEHGQALTISKKDSKHIRYLESQKEFGDKAIYGSGFLLSEKAAAEKAAAEKAAAEKAAAHVWELSEREWEIIKGLG